MSQRASVFAATAPSDRWRASRFPTRNAGERHDEWLIDEAIMETFPASDPPAPYLPAHRTPHSSSVPTAQRAAPRPSVALPWMIAAGAIICLVWLLGRRR